MESLAKHSQWNRLNEHAPARSQGRGVIWRLRIQSFIPILSAVVIAVLFAISLYYINLAVRGGVWETASGLLQRRA